MTDRHERYVQFEWLIIGADGMLGKAVSRYLRSHTVEPWETTRRRGGTGPQRILWELGQPLPWTQLPTNRPLIAVLAVGFGGLQDWEQRLDAGREFDRQVVQVVADLAHRGTRSVVFSTNLVFDGMTPRPSEADTPHPQTAYGRTRFEMEQALEALDTVSTACPCVLRLTKAVASPWNLLDRWRHELAQSRVIRPHLQKVLAPLSPEFVAEVAVESALRPDLQLLHISPDEDLAYVDLARRWCRMLGYPEECVEPIALPDTDKARGFSPPSTVLDTAKLQRELGLNAPSSWETIERVMAAQLAEIAPLSP